MYEQRPFVNHWAICTDAILYNDDDDDGREATTTAATHKGRQRDDATTAMTAGTDARLCKDGSGDRNGKTTPHYNK
jgi:hypothetical protein